MPVYSKEATGIWNFLQQWSGTFLCPLLYYWYVEFGWRDGSPDDRPDSSQQLDKAKSESHPKTDNYLTISHPKTGGNHESSGLLPTPRSGVY